jgi:hypothetical protein
MAGIQAKDLLDKLDTYHHEIVAFAQETTQNAQTLKDATEIVKGQQNTVWSTMRSLMPVILVLLAIIGLLIMKPAGVCEVSVSADDGLKIKQCEQKAEPVKKT